MGKFDPKAIAKRIKRLEEESRDRMKIILKSKELLQLIPPKSTSPTDAILLFGSHRGEKISSLLSRFETAPYVMRYLAQDPTIPPKIRKIVQNLIQFYDPFAEDHSRLSEGLNVREISPEEEDNIPW